MTDRRRSSDDPSRDGTARVSTGPAWLRGAWATLIFVPLGAFLVTGPGRRSLLASGPYVLGWLLLVLGDRRHPDGDLLRALGRSTSVRSALLGGLLLVQPIAFWLSVVVVEIVAQARVAHGRVPEVRWVVFAVPRAISSDGVRTSSRPSEIAGVAISGAPISCTANSRYSGPAAST